MRHDLKKCPSFKIALALLRLALLPCLAERAPQKRVDADHQFD